MIDPKLIRPGAILKTRSGHKARIYAVDGGGNYPVHGAVYRDGNWAAQIWTNEGTDDYDIRSAIDLISEWVEPPVKRKLYAVLDITSESTPGVLMFYRHLDEKVDGIRLPQFDISIEDHE